MIIGEGNDDGDEQRNIGEEILPPRLSNIEGNHSNRVEVIRQDIKDTRLNTASRKAFLIIVNGLRVIHATDLPIMVVVCLFIDRYPRNLTCDLHGKGEHHLEKIGEAEKGTSGTIHAQLFRGGRVTDEDNIAEVQH